MAAKKKPKAGAKRPPKTIDAYLAPLPTEQRLALERLRKIVHSVVPQVEEAISYNMPAFRRDGKWLLWLGASTKHCAIYGVQETEAGELADYDTSGRGTLRFSPEQPLPAALVRKLLKARIAKNSAKR